MSDPTVGVVIVGAGSGTRLNAGLPKAFATVGTRTILAHVVHAVFGMNRAAQVVVVAPSGMTEQASAICDDVAGPAAGYVRVVVGGATRQDSVAAALGVLHPSVSTVLVHDAARAFTPSAMFDDVVRAVETTGGGVIPVLPVSDTVKRTDADGAVVATVDRSELVAVQTPQGFPRRALDAAYAAATAEFTDDAALFSSAGHPVTVIDGDPLAFKITTPWDLRRAESVLAEAAPASESRTGVGIDVHAFDRAAELWLGGVYWPDEPGLAGHSDGDALSHSICDALLAAAGLGDIGSRFGTSDDRYAGAHGEVFIRATVEMLREAGWVVGNVSAQVVARHPRLSARRDEIQSLLSSLVGAPVSVSATTTDGLGFTGRAEGVAVISSALIHRAG